MRRALRGHRCVCHAVSFASQTSYCKKRPCSRFAPCLLTLEVNEGDVEVSVWDSSATLPAIGAMAPGRVGQHGLEIVLAVCQTFCAHREPVGRRVTAATELATTRPAAHLTHTRPDERSPEVGPEPVGYSASARQVSLRFPAIPPRESANPSACNREDWKRDPQHRRAFPSQWVTAEAERSVAAARLPQRAAEP